MLNLFFSFLALLCYLIAPIDYNVFFNQIVTVLFIIQVSVFILKKSKKNYINFYTLFFFSYFFINFFYPSVLYPIDSEFFSVFTLGFNQEVINRSTALAWLSLSFFILGASIVKKVSLNKNNTKFKYNHNKVTLLTTIFFFTFVATVGRSFLSGDFVSQSGFSLYILQIVVCLLLIATIIFFRDYNYQTKKINFYILLCFYIFLFLSVGDRGPALSLLILCLALYSHYIKKIELKKILPLALIGIILMHLIGVGRVVGSNQEVNIIARGLENFEFGINNIYDLTHSFVVNTYTLYIGVDYVDNHGLNYGENFIIYILALIPFLQGFLSDALDVKAQTSAEFFTKYILGENPSWGIGTNLVSDVYTAFGLFGCIFLFFIFGIFIEKSRLAMIYHNNIRSNIVYFYMISIAVSLPRAGLLMPLKIIIWTLIIYYILRFLKFIKSTEI